MSLNLPTPERTLWIWRHPRPDGAAGRCIGRTDLPVDARRAKRLAHRVRAHARRHGLAREVWTSPLARGADVGRWLRRWGWRWQVDAALLEVDFGAWDGRAWSDITPAEVALWEADFHGHAPGGGESLLALRQRCAAWLGRAGAPPVRLVVGHAGWINAACTLGQPLPDATHWPRPPAYGERLYLTLAPTP